MNHQLQGSNISNPNSFNQEGLRVEFQPGQFPQTKKSIDIINVSVMALIGIQITQMIIGVICIILNIVHIVLHGRFSFFGYGIWAGVFFFILWMLTFTTEKNNTNIMHIIVSTMVMNIISTILTAPVFILSVIYAEFYPSVNDSVSSDKLNHSWMGPVIAVLAFVEAIILIVSSSLCCNAYCCCYKGDKVDAIQGYPGNLSYTNESETQKPVTSVKNAFCGNGIPLLMTQILIGVTCFTINIVQLVILVTYICITGYGLWGAIHFCIWLILLKQSEQLITNKCLLVFTMILNIISTAAAIPVLVWGLIQAITYNPDFLNNGKIYITGIGSTIATISIIETVVSIACSFLHRNNYRKLYSILFFSYLGLRDPYLTGMLVVYKNK